MSAQSPANIMCDCTLIHLRHSHVEIKYLVVPNLNCSSITQKSYYSKLQYWAVSNEMNTPKPQVSCYMCYTTVIVISSKDYI